MNETNLSSNVHDLSGVYKRQYDNLCSQSWPRSTLYVVATPIGNLSDLSLRALYCLQNADVIAAEDTRNARILLEAWGIHTPTLSAHQHNEAQASEHIVSRLKKGERVALISDAGAPAVSDPGGRMVDVVRQAGYQVMPIPGPSAVITALMASGMTSDENPCFMFAGFAPSKSKARLDWLSSLTESSAPVVFYEAPHRVLDCLKDLQSVCAEDRMICVARELTKRFEEIITLPIKGMVAHFEAHSPKGEFVFVLSGGQSLAPKLEDIDELLNALLKSNSLRDSVRLAVKYTGLAKDAVYARALELKTTN